MITGVVLILISIIVLTITIKTDLENVIVENESFGRIKLYIGIGILFLVGISSILNS